ncbi:carbohydrate esterase family 4 protein [Hypoxylon sp. NC1633]|nr:carbohydrate esterase family 4 protein [Hypoxylon sp. NC1633]
MRWLIFALHTLVITAVARQGTTNLPQSHPTKRDESMGNDKSATDITDTRLPYGWKISSCTEAGTVALTFDDGPYEWTRTVAEKMDDAGFKATFFFIGKTYKRKLGLTRRMDDERTEYPDLLRSLHKRGHQLASHTWTHADLDALGREDRQQQMLDNEEAFRNVLGFMPTYMRPPKGHCGTACLEDMKTLKYHTIWWDINPEDWKYNSEDTWNETIMRFDRDLSAGGSIAVSHDVELYTVEKLLPHMISELKKRGLASVTVGECLGDLEENWYRSGRRK